MAAASVTASFDRGIVESGETVRFNVTLEGEQPTEVPKLPSLPLVQAIQYLGPRQMTQIINGVSSFQVVFQFQLQTRGQGELTMPSLAVTTRGGAFQTPSVSCRITPKEAKGQGVSLKLVTPRDECYVGETLPYDLQLYSSVNLNQIAPPKMSFDGFVTGQEVPPSNTQTIRDGQAYIVLSYRQTATPTKEGLLSLGPATQEYVLEVNRGRRPRSLIDDFFGGGAELERRTAEAPARQIQVKPLPVEGRPAGFSGAIGRFSVRTSVSRTNVAAGEAITVKWSVYGRGSFNSVQSPQLSLSDGLKTYPGTNGFTSEDSLGLAGTKTFESMVILESPSIKALTFEPYSFFDPDTGRYSTVTPRPIAVSVRPESGTSAPTPTPPAVSVAPTSRFPDRREELMSLSLRGGRRVPAELPWARQPLWLILAVLPLLGLGSLEGWRRWREIQQRRLQPTQASRMREAIRSQQAAMRVAAQGGRSEEFFAALDALLRVRCALILGLPSGDAITAQVIDEALVPKGLKAESAETLRGLFAAVDAAKFSPAAESAELTQLRAQADATLEALQAFEGGIR
ncbi:MAG: BatD family protein [Verrucomicrobia bacterium]|nr:BatD family protein [Verrucomicrobiota bacterium]